MKIPMSSPDITEAERAAVADVLSTNTLSIGPQVEKFEKALAHVVESPHAIAVSSGTAALHMSVLAGGIRDGDFAITSPFSFVSSANCLLYERAVPIFVDVDPDTGNIDPQLAVEAADDLCRGGLAARRWLPRSMRDEPMRGSLKAFLPVHAFGRPADLDPIVAAAGRLNLFVIEDACEAIGARYKGRPVGTIGDVGCFAFYPNKQMTTGEGGMLVTRRTDWDALFRSLRNQGRDVFDAWLSHSRLGYNYRLDELSCALGAVQVSRLPELLRKRARVARWYHERLSSLGEQVTTPEAGASDDAVSWFVYVIRLESGSVRRLVIDRLEQAGIPTRPYFSPIHLQPFYADRFWYRRGDFPNTERLADTSLALPFSSVMTESQVDCVCEHLAAALQQQPLMAS